MKDLKYLGTNINQHNNMYYESKLSTCAVNPGDYALKKLFK